MPEITITRDDVAEALAPTGYYRYAKYADLLGCAAHLDRWLDHAIMVRDAEWPVVVDSMDADWLGVLDRFSLDEDSAILAALKEMRPFAWASSVWQHLQREDSRAEDGPSAELVALARDLLTNDPADVADRVRDNTGCSMLEAMAATFQAVTA